jgi:DNA-binding NtrC family response regulator
MEKTIRVLIVEDSRDDALLLVRMIRQNGYEPMFKQVSTASEMTEALNKHIWDIVISDCSMPHFNGFESLKLLQKSAVDIPFIVVSGKIGEKTAAACMKAGAQDYISKDNLTRLVPVIERELQHARIKRELNEYKELISTNKARSEFLAGIGHEFRSLLTSIIGYTILLKEKIPGNLNKKQEVFIEKILTSSNHLLELINNVLDD